MSVTNNRRLKAGPQCLYSMPLEISDEEKGEFTSNSGVSLNRDKTAGQFAEEVASLPDVTTVPGAKSRILKFEGLQGRATATDATVYINVEDGTAQAGYTTLGIDATGRKHQEVVGQACVYGIRISRAPVTGTRIQPRATGGGNETVADYAVGAAINAELAADRWIRAYYLPWRSNHATTMHLGNAADFFLTSTLTGCTFHVYGTRAAPTVTHANNGAQPDLNLSQQYMTSLLAQLQADDTSVANVAARANAAQFTTYDYKVKAEPYMERKQKKFLAGDYILDRAKTHTIVVGYRDTTNGEWSFYTQQVVNLGYTRKGIKGFFGTAVKKRIFIKQARRIWPLGGGAIDADLW